MSTRAIIALKNNDGTITGTYNHSDGYPSHLLREIAAIVGRDGLTRAASTFVQYANGWSSVHSRALEDKNSNFLEGYGKYYVDSDEEYPCTASIEELVDVSDAQWVYVFDVDASVVEVIDVWGSMKSVTIAEDELRDLDFEVLGSKFESPV